MVKNQPASSHCSIQNEPDWKPIRGSQENLPLGQSEVRDYIAPSDQPTQEGFFQNLDLTESELKYLEMIDQTSDSACLEYNGRIEHVNRKFIEKFGPLASEPLDIGSDFLAIVAPHSREYVRRERMNLLLHRSLVARFKFAARDVVGKEIEVEATCSVIPYRISTALLSVLQEVTPDRRETNTQDEQQKLVEALSETASVVNSSLDFHDVMSRILASISLVIPHNSSNIMLVDEDCDTVRIVASKGYVALGLQGYQERVTLSIRNTDSLRQIYETRQPLVISDTSSVPGWVNFRETSWIQSYAAAPILVKEKVVGFLNLNSPEPNFYTPDMAKNLMAFADQAGIALTNARLLQDLQQSNDRLAKSYDITLEGWSKALELRDFETEGHSQRVVNLTLQLAARLGMTEPDLNWLRYGVLLHDIGKIGIPDRILFKPGPLSDDEWQVMRRHPEFGLKILQPVPFLAQAVDIPYCHHERWDGKGYPHGLKGEEIPLSARIFAIVDVWDGLRSIRPYHDSWPFEDAYEYIAAQSGKQFDPQIVPEFLKLISEFKDIY